MQSDGTKKWKAEHGGWVRKAKKRALVLRAARPILLRDGLAGTTLCRVAAEGGVNRPTLHRHFPSKEALFQGLVKAMCEQIRESLNGVSFSNNDRPFADRLADELRAVTAALIEPDALALYRLVIAEGWHLPDLARAFHQSVMSVIWRRTSELLEAGGLSAIHSRKLAVEVVSLTLGDAYQRAVLCIVEGSDSEAFEDQIETAVTYGLSRISYKLSGLTSDLCCPALHRLPIDAER